MEMLAEQPNAHQILPASILPLDTADDMAPTTVPSVRMNPGFGGQSALATRSAYLVKFSFCAVNMFTV